VTSAARWEATRQIAPTANEVLGYSEHFRRELLGLLPPPDIAASVTVKDENGVSIPSAAVSVSWRLPNGSTQDQTDSTSNTGVAKFTTNGRRGTYTLSINNITKTGYTFDRTNSVLSKAITK
jgi:hypothetical protein